MASRMSDGWSNYQQRQPQQQHYPGNVTSWEDAYLQPARNYQQQQQRQSQNGMNYYQQQQPQYHQPQHQQYGYNQRRGGHQQHQQPHHLAMNPNAMEFVPGRGGGARQYNQYDNFSSAYGAPMYGGGGMDSYAHHNYYQGQQRHQAPSMPQLYDDCGGGADDMYQIEQQQQYVPSQPLQEAMLKSNQAGTLQEILVGLEQLMTQTEERECEAWTGAIKDRLAMPTMTPESRTIAIQILFEMAVAVSPTQFMSGNPQYAFGKCVQTLCKEMPSLLRECVLGVMKASHDTRAELEPERRTNLLLFFAELYDKLETTPGNRVEKIGEALCGQMEDLAKETIHNDTMKTIIQTLKLCGRHLDASSSTRALMDPLLTKLGGFANGHPQLSESMKTQMRAILAERESGWASSMGHSACGSSGGGLVGVDGKPLALSDEERAFLEQHFGELDGGDSGEVDGDMMDEFEKYMQEEERNKRQKEQESVCASMEKMKMGETAEKENEEQKS